ncbi:family 10 glycosylhydrolase [Erysipelothrix sp. D19-032]
MGYDKTDPVMYYNGSTEQIEIPVAYNQEQTQFKSSWIGTIFNLHFPQISDETAFKEMYESRLDDFESWNMNAMIFQVRPLLDAFYPSPINPTSEFLSGKQGQDVDFDPLAYMVDATHERGMEYHAWFNPYRVTNSDIMSQVC